MRRLLLLLIMLSFGVTHAVAAPWALCQHPDLQAHAAALTSEDGAIASAAHGEETAAAAAEKKSSLADAASGALASMLLPDQIGLSLPEAGSPGQTRAPSYTLAGRTVPPLLDPPLL